MPSRNGPRDYLMFGMTRHDFEEARDGWNSTA
jgi:hypothetical protein